MRHRVSASTGRPSSLSIKPYDEKCATRPRRLTMICQPGSLPPSTYPLKCASIRASRCSSSPTSPGSTSTPKSAMSRSCQSIDLVGQVQVELGQAAGTVRRQCEPHRSPSNVDVGVVVAALRLFPDLLDQRERRRE